MPLSDAAKDILTFGAHSRVEDKRAELFDLQQKLDEALTERDAAITQANQAIEQLIAVKAQAIATLGGIRSISKQLRAAERNPSENSIATLPLPNLSRLETLISDGEVMAHARAGVATGASLAMGTWALGGGAGLAGAGAALGASAAGLTTVGGGALVAGGAAAGALALGSLVLLPAAAILAIFSHNSADKKISEIETEIGKALIAFEESRGVLLSVNNLGRRVREVNEAIAKASLVFENEKQKCLRRIYPFGVLSRALKAIRRFFGGNYFSKRDLDTLLPLLNMARILADLIDQKILDEKGNVV